MRTRTKRPERAADQAPEDEAPEYESIPADLAAAAAQFRQDADEHRERASRARAEAGEIVTAAEQEATRIVAEARQQARGIVSGATDAERIAGRLAERGQFLAHAAELGDQAAAAGRRADELAAEREQLLATAAELDGKITALRVERETTAADLAAAVDGADIDSITALRSRVTSIEAAEKALTGQLATARERAAAIGDGTSHHPGELLQALNVAAARTSRARDLINRAYPGSLQARLDQAHADLLGAIEGNLERLAGERRPPAPQRQITF